MSRTYNTQAFVAIGDWSAETRKHPALDYLEYNVKEYWDAADNHGSDDWHTEDFTVVTPYHEHVTGSDKHAASHTGEKLYTDVFSKFKHIPHHMIATEISDGWEVFAQFDLYANVLGQAKNEDNKVKDPDGIEWDIKIPTFHYFDIAKDASAKEHGLKLRHVKFIKDTGLVNDILDQRGVKRPSK